MKKFKNKNVGIGLKFPAGHVRVNTCTACMHGLVYVAEIIMSDNEAEIKKLKLCNNCRTILIRTVEGVFKEDIGLCKRE